MPSDLIYERFCRRPVLTAMIVYSIAAALLAGILWRCSLLGPTPDEHCRTSEVTRLFV